MIEFAERCTAFLIGGTFRFADGGVLDTRTRLQDDGYSAIARRLACSSEAWWDAAAELLEVLDLQNASIVGPRRCRRLDLAGNLKHAALDSLSALRTRPRLRRQPEGTLSKVLVFVEQLMDDVVASFPPGAVVIAPDTAHARSVLFGRAVTTELPAAQDPATYSPAPHIVSTDLQLTCVVRDKMADENQRTLLAAALQMSEKGISPADTIGTAALTAAALKRFSELPEPPPGVHPVPEAIRRVADSEWGANALRRDSPGTCTFSSLGFAERAGEHPFRTSRYYDPRELVEPWYLPLTERCVAHGDEMLPVLSLRLMETRNGSWAQLWYPSHFASIVSEFMADWPSPAQLQYRAGESSGEWPSDTIWNLDVFGNVRTSEGGVCARVQELLPRWLDLLGPLVEVVEAEFDRWKSTP